MGITESIHKARLQLAERVFKGLIEGRRTGGDFEATDRMSGRFINKMIKDGATDADIDKAEIQADRIRKRMTARNKKSSKAQALKGPLKVKAAGLPKQNAASQHLITRIKGNSANPDDPSKPSTSDIRAAAGKARYRNK